MTPTSSCGNMIVQLQLCGRRWSLGQMAFAQIPILGYNVGGINVRRLIFIADIFGNLGGFKDIGV